MKTPRNVNRVVNPHTMARVIKERQLNDPTFRQECEIFNRTRMITIDDLCEGLLKMPNHYYEVFHRASPKRKTNSIMSIACNFVYGYPIDHVNLVDLNEGE